MSRLPSLEISHWVRALSTLILVIFLREKIVFARQTLAGDVFTLLAAFATP